MNEVKFPTKGVSGKLYVFLTFVAMLLVFGAAQFFLAPSADVVNTSVGKIWGWIVEYGVRLGIVGLIVLVKAYLVFTHVLDTPFSLLGSKFRKPRNDSHAIVLVGLITEAVLLVIMVSASGFDQFLYFIMTRGALGEIVGTMATLVIARIFGVRSMDDFRDEVEKEDNDTFATLVVGVKIATFALALAS